MHHSKILLARCISNSFSSELKVGNYYPVVECLIDKGFCSIKGIKDNSGFPIQFNLINFVIV